MDLDSYLRADIAALGLIAAQSAIVEQLVDALAGTAHTDHWVFVVGNGGSASTASHAVADLVKGTALAGHPRLRALCLADNMPLFSAWANDQEYAAAFAEQVVSYGTRGDVLVAISCSGRSPNVLHAVAVARTLGIATFGLCGFDGGELARMVDHAIVINAPVIQQVEDAHHVLLHAVSLLVRDRLMLDATKSS